MQLNPRVILAIPVLIIIAFLVIFSGRKTEPSENANETASSTTPATSN